jgi:hypothetical protein
MTMLPIEKKVDTMLIVVAGWVRFWRAKKAMLALDTMKI